MKGLTKKFMSLMLAVTVMATSFAVMPYAKTETKAAAKSSNYKLVWSDEFNGTSLNTNNWNYNIGNGGSNPGWGNNELEYYTDSEENSSVSNGTLKITAKEEIKEGFGYTSARITTAGKQQFKFGRMEARIKLPSIKGVWPAFWMLGSNEKGWPWCGEIDILEAWNTYQFAQGAFHWNYGIGEDSPYDSRYVSGQLNADTNPAYKWFDKTQWHIYAVEWNEKEISWFVDGTKYYTLDVSTADKKDEATKQYFFILNVAVGGNLPGVAPDKGTLPATMEVDYVRAYQKDSDNGSKSCNWTEQSQVPQYSVKIMNGKKSLTSTKSYDGETIQLPELKKKKYVFKGWYASNGKKVTETTRVRSNMVVKAKWEKVSVKRPDITKAVSKKRKMAYLKYKVKNGSKGFQVRYGTKKNLKKFKNSSTRSKKITIPFLKSGKIYYFKVRAYKLDSKKTKVYGKWSKVKSITIK